MNRFIGFNPGIASGSTGHHYAGRNNAFWRLLHDSSLAPGLSAQVDFLLPNHGIGLTNVAARTTRSADELTSAEYREGARTLRAKLSAFRPLIACYTGKGAYRWASNVRIDHIQYGLQAHQAVEAIHDYVVPSPSGRSTIAYAVKLGYYMSLKLYADLLQK